MNVDRDGGEAPERRTVLITGATGGIGRALARAFAAEGDRLALQWFRDAEGARALERDLGDFGSVDPSFFRADLRDPAQSRRLVDRVEEDCGAVDVLVNNAGIFVEHDPLDTSDEEWDRIWDETLALNLAAPARLAIRVARGMVEAGRPGTIIDVSSRGAFRGEPQAPAYGASKAGLNSFGQSLARALGARGIAVFTLAPGFVDTPMAASSLAGPNGAAVRSQSPMDRVATPEEVAYWAVSCARPAATFATGTIIDINGASYLRS